MVQWLEEHHANLKTLGKEAVPGMDAPEIDLVAAMHAIRNSKIKTESESSNKIEDLSEQQSVMSSVDIKNESGNLPVYIDFTCTPYHGLKLPLQALNQNDDDENMQRTFRLRVSVITDGDKPAFSLSLLNREHHQEVMTIAFKEQLDDELTADTTTIRIGTFN